MEGSLEIESNNSKKPIERSAWQVVQTYFNVLNHIFASVVAIYMTFQSVSTRGSVQLVLVIFLSKEHVKIYYNLVALIMRSINC